MPDIDITTAMVAGASALGGAILTFFTANRDSVSKANEHAIISLLQTIDGVSKHSARLEERMKLLDLQLDELIDENEQLRLEIKQFRATLAEYQQHEPHTID